MAANNLLPRIIHQTFRSKQLPDALRDVRESWRLVNGDRWQLRFYDDADCIAFVEREFPEYAEAYRCSPGAKRPLQQGAGGRQCLCSVAAPAPPPTHYCQQPNAETCAIPAPDGCRALPKDVERSDFFRWVRAAARRVGWGRAFGTFAGGAGDC